MANFEAMITIYSPQGTSLLTLSNIGTGSKGYYSLMQHDYIVLKFSLAEPVEFKRGCYVDLTGQFDDALGGKLAKKYYVTSQQTPTYNTSTGGYDYELRLDAYYWLWNNYIFKYLPENAGSEASWSLTAALDVHLGVFLRNLAALGFTYNGTPFTYSMDSTVANKAVTMTYDNIHLLDALFSLGGKDAFDCDVWVTESVIHFGRCELGSAVKIERGVEAESITRSDSKGTFATRIYAFGSTRNIPANYRPIEEQAVVNGVVQKRLMLPNGTPYVDAYEDMADTEVVEDVVVFDDIYPRRVGTLSNVTTRTETVDNEDGTQNTYTYYRYKDTGLQFNSDYRLEGQELQITFQSGKMNGMTFVVTFNPDDKDPEEQLWEIVANEDYGRLLPDDTIKPENGDEYVLSGFDIQLVSDQYIPEAERELLARAKEYVAKTKVDDGTYTATLMSAWVYEDQIHRTFDVGQRITLVASDFFTDDRSSRVIGWEMCLDIPYDHPVYIIGESAQYSRLGDIEQKVETLTYRGQTYTGTGGSGVYVIRTNDPTPASDSNVYSALRSLAMFLRKDVSDSTNYLMKFLGGLEVGEFIDSMLAGKGAGIMPDGRMQLDRLEVRGSMTVMDLVVNMLQGMAADYSFSDLGKITQVDDLGDGTYKLWLEKRTDYDFTTFGDGDVCYSIVNTLYKGGTDYFTSWMRLLNVNLTDNAVTVVLYPDSEVPGGKNYAPLAGYNMTRRGNATVPVDGEVNERAQSWLLSSREGRIMFLQNVFKPILESFNYGIILGKLPKIGELENLPIEDDGLGIVADYGIFRNFWQFDGNGKLVTKQVFRGEWSLAVAQSDEPYRYWTHEWQNPSSGLNVVTLEQHTVSYLGCIWGCLIDNTTEAPKWNSAAWQMLQGDPNYYLSFDHADPYSLHPGNVDLTLTARVRYGNDDITDVLMATAGVEVEWTRDTGEPSADNAWKPEYVEGMGRNTIHVDRSDATGVGEGFGSRYRQATLTCRIYIPVGGTEPLKVENSIGLG